MLVNRWGVWFSSEIVVNRWWFLRYGDLSFFSSYENIMKGGDFCKSGNISLMKKCFFLRRRICDLR
jgi:hypothetical protein